MTNIEYAISCLSPILSKLPITMYLTLASTVLSLAGGMVFALLVRSHYKAVSWTTKLICSFLKGVPVLVLLYVFNYSMPDVLGSLGIPYDLRNPPKNAFAIIALGCTYIPYMCDMILSALDTVPKGQMEACLSLGYTKTQAMRRIVIPQMAVVSVPVFGNHFTNLLKATSLAYMVTIVEMMGAAKNYATGTQKFLITYVVAALIYWAICIAFDKLFAIIEHCSGKYRNAVAPEVKKVQKVGIFRSMLHFGLGGGDNERLCIPDADTD